MSLPREDLDFLADLAIELGVKFYVVNGRRTFTFAGKTFPQSFSDHDDVVTASMLAITTIVGTPLAPPGLDRELELAVQKIGTLHVRLEALSSDTSQHRG